VLVMQVFRHAAARPLDSAGARQTALTRPKKRLNRVGLPTGDMAAALQVAAVGSRTEQKKKLLKGDSCWPANCVCAQV
jgi:hypothetical protein